MPVAGGTAVALTPSTAAAAEASDVQRQAELLMQFVLPRVPSCEWKRLDFEEEVWALVPPLTPQTSAVGRVPIVLRRRNPAQL